jgi:CheY-like chemotaxis protein/two-component sensor histidine kinase
MPEKQKFQYVKLIIQSSDRLIALLCDLLDLGKLNANKMLINCEKYDLQTLITEVVQDLIPLSIAKKIPINFRLNKKISSITVLDKIRISQVLRNLISNALKYSHSGEILIKISYQQDRPDEKPALLVQIQDQGIGIPQEELNIIFLPFTQSSNNKNHSGGTGLGLAICAEIINLHKGRIWAINNASVGATFNFTLPIINSTEDRLLQQIIQKINQMGACLILDDDYLAIESGKIILSSIGLKVLTSCNTTECLEKINTNKISILFLDMTMLDMSGVEFLQIIKQNPAYDHIKVILVSGIYSADEIDKAISLGALTHLIKPYNKAQTIQEITNLFQDLLHE